MKRKKFPPSSPGYLYAGLLTAILLSCNHAIAQLSPANDPSWILQPILSDEFNYPDGLLPLQPNGSPLPTNDKWYPHGYMSENGQPMSTSNARIHNPASNMGNGEVRFIFTGNTADPGPKPPSPLPAPYTSLNDWWWHSPTGLPTCDWKDAGVYSNPWHLPGPVPTTPIQFSFGYFELYARLPGYISSGQVGVDNHGYNYDYSFPGAGKMTQRGISPLWWFSGKIAPDCSTGQCLWEEVDVMEGSFDAGDVRPSISTHWNRVNVCDNGKCITDGSATNMKFFPMSGETDIDVVNQFHKYGFEWMPDKMVFYFDDVPYYTDSNLGGIPQHPMAMYLGLMVGTPAYNFSHPNGLIENTAPVVPNYDPNNTMQFVIDYFRYYKMNTANCSNDYIISNPADLTNFPSAPADTWKNVTVTGNVALTGANTYKLVRHSADFTVTAGVDFEVPLGSELAVIPTPCQ